MHTPFWTGFWGLGFLSRLLTAEPVKWLLGVGVTVTALPDVAGLQLHHHLHRGHRLITRFQVDIRKECQGSSARLVFHPVVPSCADPQGGWGGGERRNTPVRSPWLDRLSEQVREHQREGGSPCHPGVQVGLMLIFTNTSSAALFFPQS